MVNDPDRLRLARGERFGQTDPQPAKMILAEVRQRRAALGEDGIDVELVVEIEG